MGTPYTGNPDAYVDPITMPDDTDPPDADNVTGPMQSLLDDVAALSRGKRVQLADLATLKALDTTTIPDGAVRNIVGYGAYKLDKTVNPTFTETSPVVIAPTTGTGRWFAQDTEAKVQYVKSYLAAGSFTYVVPPNLEVLALDIGGAGGGGGGGANTTAGTDDAPGGSGGGGGARTTYFYDVSGGDSIDVEVGAGGTAGAANGGLGGDGGDSSFDIAIAKGGQGGQGSIASGGAVSLPGGVGAGAGLDALAPLGSAAQWMQHAGDGGYARNGTRTGATGASSTNGSAGGTPGTHGTTDGSQAGGSGGGGGGGGPLLNQSPGGAGGNGGNGNASGAATVGANGSVGVVGGGGGGGGGAGAGSTGSKNGGAGGAGADGYVIIRGVR